MIKALFLIAVLALLTGCYEQKFQNESDVKKYPELVPFIDSFGEFVQAEADLDIGILEAEYIYDKDIQNLKKIADQEGWKVKKVAEKFILLNGDHDGRSSSLRLKVTENRRIHLNWRVLP